MEILLISRGTAARSLSMDGIATPAVTPLHSTISDHEARPPLYFRFIDAKSTADKSQDDTKHTMCSFGPRDDSSTQDAFQPTERKAWIVDQQAWNDLR